MGIYHIPAGDLACLSSILYLFCKKVGYVARKIDETSTLYPFISVRLVLFRSCLVQIGGNFGIVLGQLCEIFWLSAENWGENLRIFLRPFFTTDLACKARHRVCFVYFNLAQRNIPGMKPRQRKECEHIAASKNRKNHKWTLGRRTQY